MAKFISKLPDGRQVEINAPDGATQDQADAFAMQQFKAGAYSMAQPEAEQAPPTQWSEVPGQAISNIPESGAKLAGQLYEAVTNPIQTLDAITKIGAGALQLVMPESVVNAIGKDQASIDMAKQVGQFFVDRYGSEEAAMKTIAQDPVGAAADVSAVLTGIGGATRLGGAVTGSSALSKAGKVAEVGGRLTDPVLKTFQALKYGGETLAKAPAAGLGVTTGVGTNTIVEAFRAAAEGGERGTLFREAMRKDVDLSQIVDEAKAALESMKAKANESYKSDMKAIQGDRTVLAFDDIDSAWVNAMDTLGQFGGKVKSQKAIDALNEIKKKVDDWKAGDPQVFASAYGLDQLKQAIWDVIEPLQKGSSSANRTAELAGLQVYNAIKDTIAKQAPSYSQTMKNYANAQDEINMITHELSLGKGKMPDTSLRKLMSILRDNVNTNFSQRRSRADALEAEGANIIPQIAGAELSTLAPRGAGRFTGGGVTAGALYTGDPLTALGAAAASSPRIAGEAANLAGQVARPIVYAGEKIKKYTPDQVIPLIDLATDPRAIGAFLQQQRIREQQQ